MNILSVTFDDDMWQEVSQFAQSCSWRAGKALSQSMSDNAFTAWERVIVALHENDIAGYCTVAKSDCIPNVPYTPYIGYMFVDEKYGFKVIDKKVAPWGKLEEIFMHELYKRWINRHSRPFQVLCKLKKFETVSKKCRMKHEETLCSSDWNNQKVCDTCYYAPLKLER